MRFWACEEKMRSDVFWENRGIESLPDYTWHDFNKEMAGDRRS